jgi:hypothetical protein
MGDILKRVFEQQLDGHVTTLDDAIAARPHPATSR